MWDIALNAWHYRFRWNWMKPPWYKFIWKSHSYSNEIDIMDGTEYRGYNVHITVTKCLYSSNSKYHIYFLHANDFTECSEQSYGLHNPHCSEIVNCLCDSHSLWWSLLQIGQWLSQSGHIRPWNWAQPQNSNCSEQRVLSDCNSNIRVYITMFMTGDSAEKISWENVSLQNILTKCCFYMCMHI